MNFAREYRERVFNYFLEEYRQGRTPNPDVLCNREIKWNVFLKFALQLGAEKLATGHFARLDYGDETGWRLLRAADENKDQTYFLYMIGQEALSHALFPVGHLTKAEIRHIAREAAIPVSEKKDSTGVCFIGERNFKRFLSEYLPAQPGDMRTPDGKLVGRHDGLMYYTLGQRRGLGIGGGGDGRRWFVVGKDLKNNVLLVEQGEDSPLLYSERTVIEELTWIAGRPPVKPGEALLCQARFRHRQPLQNVSVRLREDGLMDIEFETPQRAITPGQSAVLYLGEACLGGGVIQ